MSNRAWLQARKPPSPWSAAGPRRNLESGCLGNRLSVILRFCRREYYGGAAAIGVDWV
jgi:hypothetical protein